MISLILALVVLLVGAGYPLKLSGDSIPREVRDDPGHL